MSAAIGTGYRCKQMRRLRALSMLATGVAMFASQAQAIPVTLTGSDPINTTSFNAAGLWDNAAAPSAGNTYFTSAFTLRTPASGAHTFQGDSLSIDAGGVFAFKTPGIITVNNLILNGGQINNFGVGGGEVATLNGDITLAAASAIDSSVSPRTFVINSTIGGGAPLTLAGTTGITLNGNNNYAGATTVTVNSLTINNANALGASGAGNETTIVGGNAAGARSLILGTGSAMNIAESLNFNANAAGRAGLSHNSGQNHTLSGPIDVSSTGNLVQWSSNGGGSITVTGDITGTMSGGSLLFLRGGSTSSLNRILGSLNLTGGDLAKTDTGTWVVGNAGETYSWVNTRAAVGTLRMNLANIMPATGTITIGQNDNLSAVLDLAGFSQTTAGITYNYGGSATTSTGQINTGAGTLTLNGNLTYNTAAGYTGAGGSLSGNLNLGGGTRTFTINDGGAPVEFTLSANVSNGGLTKSGGGTMLVTGNNNYAGATRINNGVLRLTTNTGLGTTAGGLSIAGNTTGNGILELTNNIAIGAEALTLEARQGATLNVPHLRNLSGNNSYAGAITLTTGGSDYNLESAAGLLTLSGGIVASPNSGVRNLKLSGAGNGLFTGGALNFNNTAGVTNNLVKNGSGLWTLASATSGLDSVTINEGTLALTGSGEVDEAATINVGAGAFYNVTGVSGYDLVSGQSIIGDGNIVGNVITDAGSFVSPGVGAGDIGVLTFDGNLDIDGSLVIDLDPAGAGSADMIIANGILDLSGATLDLNLVSTPLDDWAYVIAEYDSLVGTFSVANVPSNFMIQYNYLGRNQIAITQMPEPATMSLLALGGAVLLRRRRVTR